MLFFFEHNLPKPISQLSFRSSTCRQVYVICLKQANLQDNFVSACINANLSKVKLTDLTASNLAFPYDIGCYGPYCLWPRQFLSGAQFDCFDAGKQTSPTPSHILQRKHTHSVYPFYSVNSITCTSRFVAGKVATNGDAVDFFFGY